MAKFDPKVILNKILENKGLVTQDEWDFAAEHLAVRQETGRGYRECEGCKNFVAARSDVCCVCGKAKPASKPEKPATRRSEPSFQQNFAKLVNALVNAGGQDKFSQKLKKDIEKIAAVSKAQQEIEEVFGNVTEAERYLKALDGQA